MTLLSLKTATKTFILRVGRHRVLGRAFAWPRLHYLLPGASPLALFVVMGHNYQAPGRREYPASCPTSLTERERARAERPD
jgi:hypothetical protein